MGRVAAGSKNVEQAKASRGVFAGKGSSRRGWKEGAGTWKRTGGGEVEGSGGRAWASLLSLPSSRQVPLSPSTLLALLPGSPSSLGPVPAEWK